MPEPISPQPKTPTFLISIILSSRQSLSSGAALVAAKDLCIRRRKTARVLRGKKRRSGGQQGAGPHKFSGQVLEINQVLDHHGDPLPAANARRGQPIFLFAPPQLIQQ